MMNLRAAVTVVFLSGCVSTKPEVTPVAPVESATVAPSSQTAVPPSASGGAGGPQATAPALVNPLTITGALGISVSELTKRISQLTHHLPGSAIGKPKVTREASLVTVEFSDLIAFEAHTIGDGDDIKWLDAFVLPDFRKRQVASGVAQDIAAKAEIQAQAILCAAFSTDAKPDIKKGADRFFAIDAEGRATNRHLMFRDWDGMHIEVSFLPISTRYRVVPTQR